MIMNIINFLIANYEVILAGVVGVCLGLIAIFTVIPGEQPEKALQGFVDFIKKFSKK